MTEDSNPAGRLRAILLAGKEEDRALPAEQIWARLLKVKEDDHATLLNRLGHVLALPSQIERGLAQIPGIEKERYLNWVPKVKQSFSNLNLAQNWAAFINPIDDAVMDGLGTCSDQLRRVQTSPTVEENQLEEILESAKALFDEVMASTIDQPVRQYLLKHLEAVTRAVEEYQIQGAEVLRAAVHELIGSIVAQPEFYSKTRETETGTKFWDFMGRIAIVVGITSGVVALADKVVGLLPPA
ncbi:MAG: hypothetical protein JSU63_16220 [Phycisphaerales bacterium]|nr:MAG: hypothetical protein JSU63_16220 [Phycisphaerales bacterium]